MLRVSLLQVQNELHVCVLRLGCAAARCRCRVLLRGVAVTLPPLQGAAARCRCRVPLQGAARGCQRAASNLGTWVLLQGAAVRVWCALWSLGAGVGACEMPMAMWALRSDCDGGGWDKGCGSCGCENDGCNNGDGVHGGCDIGGWLWWWWLS